MRKVTKTTGRLHFEDLSPERFEDMCVQVVYRLRNWNKIQHFGRKGKDRGVDIFTELLEEKVLEEWVFQCKRYKTITLGQAKIVIDDFVKKNKPLPDKYRLIVACDVSRKMYEEFLKYTKRKGIADTDIISASILEAELYARHPDILYTFFNVRTYDKRVTTVARIKRRLAMRRKIERELKIDPAARDVIIRDVHRDIYPQSDLESLGISSWFKLEYFQLYHRGVSFYMSVVNALVNKNNEWKLTDYASKVPSGWEKINAFRIGNIPYDNIVEFDGEGDEYYPFPHFYCEFNNLGEPYEEIWYEPTDEYKKQIYFLEKEKEIK